MLKQAWIPHRPLRGPECGSLEYNAPHELACVVSWGAKGLVFLLWCVFPRKKNSLHPTNGFLKLTRFPYGDCGILALNRAFRSLTHAYPASFISLPVHHSCLIMSPSSPVMMYPCVNPTSALSHVLNLLSGVPFFPSLPGVAAIYYFYFLLYIFFIFIYFDIRN